MIAIFTEDVLTPFSFEEADEAMTAALPKGSRVEVRALALAKTALETGRWKKIHCSNWGNVKAGDTYSGMFTSFACGEELAQGSCWFEPDGTIKNLTKGTVTKPQAFDVPPGHPMTRFRAYANRFDGAFEYVDFVQNGRYAQAWLALLAGDAVGYVHQLKLKGYFTAAEAPYADGVVALQREFVGKLRGELPEPATVDWGRVQACAPFALDLSHEADSSAAFFGADNEPTNPLGPAQS